MEKYCYVLLIAVSTLACSGCSSSSADSVDSGTKVLASNVVIDNSKTKLSSTTLQSAIEELAPLTLSASGLTGTWDVTNYPNSTTDSTGKVTFKSDGTYSVTSGSFRVAGNFIDAPYTGKWKVLEGTLFELISDIPDVSGVTANSGAGTAFRNSVGTYAAKYPQPLLFNNSRIILKDGAYVAVLKPAQ
jgi:hypothetical protein